MSDQAGADLSDRTAVKRRLADFLGQWHIARRIRQSDGTETTFDGMADWRADGPDASYCETGTLTVPDHPPIHATRRYLWRSDLSVWFPDGRLFHHVPAEGGAVRHDCAPDIYQGWYDFSAWPQWALSWQVSGPRKRYKMRSIYRR